MSEQLDAAMMYELGKQKGYDAAIKDVVAWLRQESHWAIALQPVVEADTAAERSRLRLVRMHSWANGLPGAIERGDAKGASNDLP